MASILNMVDELLKRGAIEISYEGLHVKFAAASVAIGAIDPEPIVIEKPLTAEDLEQLLYDETTKL